MSHGVSNFKKEMAKDERRGMHIDTENDLWVKLEFEESFLKTRGHPANLIEECPIPPPPPEPDPSNALVMYTGEKRKWSSG